MAITGIAVSLFERGYGVLAIVGWFLYQLYAPSLFNRETLLGPFFHDIPEKVETIDEKQDEITSDINDVQSHVQEVQSRQKIQMQVQRAQARANDQMNEDEVDNYLLQNGVEPDEFLHGDKMAGYRNWTDTEMSDNDSDDASDSTGGADE